ncbi:MAG: hypothetical protein V4792_21065 [Pseudomonadota bacterium]
MSRALQRLVFGRRWLTFVVMGLAFLGFGAGTFNLFILLKANTDLVFEHGWMALGDGAAQQLLELLFTAYLSMAAYLLFKACEHRLVHWLAAPERDIE